MLQRVNVLIWLGLCPFFSCGYLVCEDAISVPETEGPAVEAPPLLAGLQVETRIAQPVRRIASRQESIPTKKAEEPEEAEAPERMEEPKILEKPEMLEEPETVSTTPRRESRSLAAPQFRLAEDPGHGHAEELARRPEVLSAPSQPAGTTRLLPTSDLTPSEEPQARETITDVEDAVEEIPEETLDRPRVERPLERAAGPDLAGVDEEKSVTDSEPADPMVAAAIPPADPTTSAELEDPRTEPEATEDEDAELSELARAVKQLRELAEVAGSPFSLADTKLPILRFTEFRPREVTLSPEASWIDFHGAALPMELAAIFGRGNQKGEEPASLAEQLEELRVAAQTGERKALRLTREQLIQLLLQHSQDLQVERMEWDIKEFGVSREVGGFEPQLVATSSRQINERKNTVQDTLSQFREEYRERNNRLNSGVEGRVPTGGTYRVGYSLDRLSNNLTASGREQFAGEYVSFLGVSLSQPLLRNAWFKANLAPIRMAKKDSQIAYQNLRKRMMQLTGQAESIYWELVVAQRQHELATASVEIAQRVLDDYKERMETGKVSELERYQAEAGLADRQAKQSAANQRLTEVMNALRNMFSDSIVKSNTLIVAVDQPTGNPGQVDFFESMGRALDANADYLSALRMLEKERIRVALAKNQRLPQVDLEASYGLNGLGDSVADSWQTVTDSGYKSWSVGIEMRIPLGGGKSARSESKAAKLRKRQALLSLKSLEVRLSNEVDTVIHSIENSRELIRSARVRAEFSQRLLDADLEHFKEGKSDSRRIFEIEEDLFEARLLELGSLIEHQKTLLMLELLEGSFLRNRGIEVRNGK